MTDAETAQEIRDIAKRLNDWIRSAMKGGLIVTVEVDSPQSIDVNGRRVNVPGVKVRINREL